MAHAPQPRLDTLATDRAAGVLLGAAVGDALGVPYEFEATLRDDQQPRMIGGGLGPYEPGEYSDDTQMQVCIAEVTADGADLRSPGALDGIAANFQGWLSGGASDVGAQTRAVLGTASSASGAPGAAMLAAARSFTAGNDRGAGNGSLMRTGIVALGHLGDTAEMAEAAVAVSALTHPDPDCADACVLWCSGIRTAVLHGTFDGVRAGLDLLPAERREAWAKRLDEAEANPPHHFANNGWVVHALQAAWSAIIRTAVPELSPAGHSFPAQHFGLALEAAVRAGTDTDTVAAIAGALLGARWGCSGIPLEWQQAVHGWPGHTTGADLVRLAVRTARGGSDDVQGWPSAPRMSVGGHHSFAIPHPHDPGVLLGNLALAQGTEPVAVDAVVSLCRTGTDPILPGTNVEHVRVWLVDSQGENANLHYVLDQAARQVLRLRQEGKRVLLHCLAGQSRTPAVAAIYSHLATGTDSKTALNDLRRVLTNGWHLDAHPQMHDAVHELTTAPATDRKTAGAVPRKDQARDITGGAATVDTTNPREDAAAEQDSLFASEADVNRRLREFPKDKRAASRVRGLLLGLALGDTLGRAQDKLPADGPLRAGVSTQLACFTAEGVIRALVRGDHKGLCHPPTVVWHAYGRWAALQGLKARRWGTGEDRWPDGWLAQVPVLAERRGSAPATVTALAKSEHGNVETPTTSRGCHALTRTLPAALLGMGQGFEPATRWAHEMAALTHGDPAAQSATAQAVALVSHCLISLPGNAASSDGPSQVQQALQKGLLALRRAGYSLDARVLDRLAEALQEAINHPADAKRLAKLAPDATAPSALFGGVYVAASFLEPAQVHDALRFAAGAPDGDSVACVAGALLGAAHGAEALPIDLVSRHELAWVLDTLARDLVAQLADAPSGSEYVSGWDPHWWDRYPGW
ncbi:ADP-ribosylglycohydrolase family protein [Streptomyces sp. NBC_01635]|uniref:ADP-ribosylglycohydrolase family protein n=1 Tax=Streptomyces sp. NBC_01635 TaxID=2975904 RepID=UPI00386F49FA|nr:ADP-ribosylglycohydrolase family protein [Streptomyces sp. NBC_01635]